MRNILDRENMEKKTPMGVFFFLFPPFKKLAGKHGQNFQVNFRWKKSEHIKYKKVNSC